MSNANKQPCFLSENDFRRYYGRCVAFAQSYIHDSLEAESIAADALSIYAQKCSEGEVIEHILPFLFSVVRNKALHYLRHKSIEYQVHGHIREALRSELELRINALESCDPHTLYKADVQLIIKSSLESMSEQTSSIFKLSRFEGKSNAQIAALLGVTEKTVEYHITKALKLLRTNLKDYLPLISILLGL
jgi:RNA polymerase sigma-70 factor (ECF subfamily)